MDEESTKHTKYTKKDRRNQPLSFLGDPVRVFRGLLVLHVRWAAYAHRPTVAAHSAERLQCCQFGGIPPREAAGLGNSGALTMSSPAKRKHHQRPQGNALFHRPPTSRRGHAGTSLANTRLCGSKARTTRKASGRSRPSARLVTTWHKVLDWQGAARPWFVGGKLNAAANCLDRHLARAARNKAAIIWEGEPGDTGCSPIRICIAKCASSPTCSRARASGPATA